MSDDYVMTAAGLAALNAELAELEGAGREEMAERIKLARSYGDLKENAEYHDAKDRQAHLETKILRLRDRIANASVTEAGLGETGVVAFGSTVGVFDEASGREAIYSLVGGNEADAASGKISIESPVAKALLGARAGETVEITTPSGGRRLQVQSVA